MWSGCLFWFTPDAIREYSDQFDTWQPRFLDYLYARVTKLTAFSPTYTTPLRRTTKMLMVWESVVAVRHDGLVPPARRGQHLEVRPLRADRRTRKVAPTSTTSRTLIAYTALLPGTPVQCSEGHEVGRVERVLVDEKVDVFDGICRGPKTADGSRFVDADQVGQTSTSHVCTTVPAADVPHLPVTDHDPARRGDSGSSSSLGDRIGRLFGADRT